MAAHAESFVLRSGGLCLSILEEEEATRLLASGKGDQSSTPGLSISSTRMAAAAPLLAGRHVVAMASNAANPKLLATAYSPAPVKRCVPCCVRLSQLLVPQPTLCARACACVCMCVFMRVRVDIAFSSRCVLPATGLRGGCMDSELSPCGTSLPQVPHADFLVRV